MIESGRQCGYDKHVKRNSPMAPLLAVLSVIAAVAAMAAPEQPLPTPFPEARYQPMSMRSPFAVASAAAPTAAPTPGFAAQLYIDGVAHAGSSDYVAIKSRDPDNHKVLFVEVGKTTDDGLKVERVRWSDQMGKSTVDVSKAGEKATLLFDEDQIASATSQPAQPPQPGMIRQPIFPGQPRQFNFPPQTGQPQYGPRFFPQRPGMENGMQPGNFPQRRIRGMIPSAQ
jgi:hypothetical protein